MAEIGILASVIAVAGAAITSSKALFEIVDQIRNAPEEVSAISRDTHAFHDVVSSVRGAIKDPAVVKILQEDHKLCDLVGNLEGPLQNCSTVLMQLRPRIQAHLKPSSDDELRANCRNRLEAIKSTLDAALTSVVFLCSLRSAGRDSDDLGNLKDPFGKGDLDAGSALLDYAESIAPHSPALDAVSEPVTSFESPLDDLKSLEPILTVIQPRTSPEAQSNSIQNVVNPNPIISHKDVRYSTQDDPFFYHVQEGNVTEVESLLKERVDVNVRGKDGKTALHLAAEYGHEDIVRLLTSNNADVNASIGSISDTANSINDKRTPLHVAATEGDQTIVRILLDHNADMAALNSGIARRTPLHLAMRYRNDDIAMLLLRRGSPLMSKDCGDRTLLHEATYTRNFRLVEEVIKQGRLRGQLPAMLKATDSLGGTPLHCAARVNNLKIVLTLLESGADINAKGPLNGATPMIGVAYDGDWKAMAFLVTRGADYHIKNNDGQTAAQTLKRAHPEQYEEFHRFMKGWQANSEFDQSLFEDGSSQDKNQRAVPPKSLRSPIVEA